MWKKKMMREERLSQVYLQSHQKAGVYGGCSVLDWWYNRHKYFLGHCGLYSVLD